MTFSGTKKYGLVASVVAVLTLCFGLAHLDAGEGKPAGKYVGAKKCKNCHKSKAAGDQYGTWAKMQHAKAYKTLGTPEAKKVAAEKGIANPQTSPECLKCHVTAFGVPKSQLSRKFDPKLGVQCESCHGPGNDHVKARMAAAANEEDEDEGFGNEDEEEAVAEYTPVPEGEIIVRPEVKLCLECHNTDSPSFKGFCFTKRFADLAHLDPRKKRAKNYLDTFKCGCGDVCKCVKAECGGYPDK